MRRLRALTWVAALLCIAACSGTPHLPDCRGPSTPINRTPGSNTHD